MRTIGHLIINLLVSLFLLTLSATPAWTSGPGDPTAALVPSVECDTPTCEEAAAAFAEREYARAGELFATHFESTETPQTGAWLVHAAYSHRLAEDWEEAAQLYEAAADEVEPLHQYLLTQAVRASLEKGGDESLFERALKAGALRAGYADGYFLKARIQARNGGEPTAEIIEQALRNDDLDEVCSWLLDHLVNSGDGGAALFDLAYGQCVDADFDEQFAELTHEPAATAKLQRSGRLAREVRFADVLAELDSIDTDQLSPVETCRADFRRARSHFFLRQRGRAEEIYRQVVENCTDEKNEDERVRGLYAVGNRNYQRGRLDEAERFFTELYETYPYRSHADDALFFLARIERGRDNPDREREIELLVEALEKYPHEDMIHEMAWEVFESDFRQGNYREFIDAITALPLPDWDHEYFSQGRLEYFVGVAHQRLDELDDAERYWQLGWVKYPFSFYGYLAHLRLVEHDRIPEPLDTPNAEEATHWFDDAFEGTGADILARTGHLSGACDFESARLDSIDASRSDRWRLATLCHQAGEYPISHNIARRQIQGRPWSLPMSGRLARWHVAWPDPYRAELTQAIADLGPDGNRYVHPGFASSIMREESSFYEEIISWAGAVGLMQLMPATAGDHADVVDEPISVSSLQSAQVNIPVGIDHIAHLSRRYDGHPVLMTAAYNAGGGRINGWLRRQPNDEIGLWVEDIPILETRNYTKRVIGSYAAYQYLHGEQTLDDRIIAPAR